MEIVQTSIFTMISSHAKKIKRLLFAIVFQRYVNSFFPIFYITYLHSLRISTCHLMFVEILHVTTENLDLHQRNYFCRKKMDFVAIEEMREETFRYIYSIRLFSKWRFLLTSIITGLNQSIFFLLSGKLKKKGNTHDSECLIGPKMIE